MRNKDDRTFHQQQQRKGTTMTEKERDIADIVFDAMQEGNALNIETNRRIYQDCAVLGTTEDHVKISTFDVIKGCEREFDIVWDDIIDVAVF